MTAAPRVLFVGRSRYELPLPEWLARKWDAIGDVLDYRVLGASARPDGGEHERFELSAPAGVRALDAPLFYAALPSRIAREIRAFAPDVVVAADPYVGAAALTGRALARRRPRVIVEVHGEWRTFARLYGSRLRRAVSPATDAIAAWSVRRADATRALSRFTSSLVEQVRGLPATASFPTYSDLSAFTAKPVRPLPGRPTALFVGALEEYKNVRGLAEAWLQVERRVPRARLVIVGDGSRRAVVARLVAELPDSVRHHPQLEPTEVAAALDEATVLVLPSWPEGLGRVVIEAFARGRGVVATDAGGIPDLVDDGVQGLLVPRGDTRALVEALVRVLSDPELAARLAAAASERYPAWHSSPELFARRTRELVDRVLGGER